MKHCFATATVLSLLVCAAEGQVADDKELYAAYCIGSLTEAKTESWLNDSSEQDDPLIRQLQQEAQQIMEQKLSRFRAYLNARGFFIGARRTEAQYGVVLAMRRGQADQRQCAVRIQYGISSCKPDGGDSVLRSGKECRDQDAACRSVVRCVEPDSLPF
jgi:hypothetical protein